MNDDSLNLNLFIMESNKLPRRQPLVPDQHDIPSSRFAETYSKVLSGSYGTILFSQIAGSGFTFRHYHCFINHPCEVPCVVNEPNLFLFVNLKHTIVLDFSRRLYAFYEWACNLLYQPAEQGTAVFHKPGNYSFFTIHFSREELAHYWGRHHNSESFLLSVQAKQMAMLNCKHYPMNAGMRAAVSDMLYCDFTENYYAAWLELKSKELLLPFFNGSGLERSKCRNRISEDDAEAIYKIKEKLLAEPWHDHLLHTLSHYVNLSSTKLKVCFKEIYGLAWVDFRKEVRMKKAYQLVAYTSLPFEDIAIRVGYSHSSSFWKTFKKEIGISPKRLRDSTQDREEGEK